MLYCAPPLLACTRLDANEREVHQIDLHGALTHAVLYHACCAPAGRGACHKQRQALLRPGPRQRQGRSHWWHKWLMGTNIMHGAAWAA